MITKRQRYIRDDEFRYRDDNPFHQYLKEKGRDVPETQTTPVSEALRALDVATIQFLYHGGSEQDVDLAFENVLTTPGNTWSRDELAYRQRQEHYK